MSLAYLTEEEALKIVQNNGRRLDEVPTEYRSPELCRAAVQHSGSSLEFVPPVWKDEELCLTAVKKNGYALMWVPRKLRTLDICRAAVKNDPDALRYAPQDKTWFRELCRVAVQQKGSSLESVPDLWKDEELCLTAVQQLGDALQWVPPELKTVEISRAALSGDPAAFEHVPEDKKWVRDAMEDGHLLAVHFLDMATSVEVTNMGGECVVKVQTNPCDALKNLLALLHKELDDRGYTFQKRFILPNGRFLHEWQAEDLIAVVLTDIDVATCHPSGWAESQADLLW